MSLYTYTIVRDFGFAPNPFGGTCSLATCKTKIRSKAQSGDWIAGFGGKNTLAAHQLVYLMKVDKVYL